MRKTSALILLAIVLIFSTAFAAENSGLSLPTYEGAGFATAEEAAQFYLESLQSGDLRKMLSAFAIETYIDNFDFTAQLQRIRAYTPSAAIAFPNSNRLLRDLNVESRKQDIVNRMRTQLITICIPGYDGYSITTFGQETPDSDIADFVNRFQENPNVSAFERIQFTGFLAPSDLNEIYSDERLQQIMAEQAAVFGADELCSVVATFTLDGNPYVHCFNAMRYGEKWYLESLGGHIAQFLGLATSTGGIMPRE